MLQTNYSLPIDLDIVCENETLKKVVGPAGVESARRTGELWNYLPVLCYMRFSPYSIRVKLNRFADPRKKYSCKVYIDEKTKLKTTPLKINQAMTFTGIRKSKKKYPFEFDLAMMDPGEENKSGSSSKMSDAEAERIIRIMSTFRLEVWENSVNMETKQRVASGNVPERAIIPMDDKLNGVNKVSTRFGDGVATRLADTYRTSKRIKKLGSITYRYRAARFLQDKNIIDPYFEVQHVNARAQQSGGSGSSSNGLSSSNNNANSFHPTQGDRATKRKFKRDRGAVDGGGKKRNRSP
eukprot:g1383.t1